MTALPQPSFGEKTDLGSVLLQFLSHNGNRTGSILRTLPSSAKSFDLFQKSLLAGVLTVACAVLADADNSA